MDKQSIIQYKTSFDAIASYIEGNSGKDKVEIWFARDLQPLLGYARWENFQVAINRAVESCKTQGASIDDHFRDLTKMVTLGSGATREVQDYMLIYFAQSPCKLENKNRQSPHMPSLLLWHCPSCPLKSYLLPILDSSGKSLSFHSC